MSYAGTRDSELWRVLQVPVQQFIQRYTSKTATEGRRTLFLFPGGMGCQLLRARTPYRDNILTHQTFRYDKVWLTLKTFLGDALTLPMHHDPRDPPAVERDLDDRIIVADGAIELFGITPYDRFTSWCELNDLDWFIFGWDWRRRLEDTVSFFLAQFLPRFRSAVQNACGADPLNDFVLIGHSFGGMVVNLILHQANSLLDTMTRAITVAAPFYGYDGQIHRWFEGDQYFNQLGKTAVIEVISSMPACYTLPYLDNGTYNVHLAQLQADPDFPLRDYSSHDTATPAQIADPFNPVGRRYPANTGFDVNLLNDGLHAFQQLVLPPLPRHASKFFNIRGVQFANDAIVNNTVQDIRWQLLAGPNNPAASPIHNDLALGPGDDTLPAWSTRHAALPSAQWVTVKDAIHHMLMMEYDATQEAVAQVLSLKNKPLRDAPLVEAADRDEALRFVNNLQDAFAREEPGNREAFLKTYVARFPLAQLQSIGRRIMMDVLKARQSVPEAEPAPDDSAAAPRRRRASRGATRRPGSARER